MLANQQASAQRISARRNGLGSSSATFNRITRLDLQLYSYHMIKRHQLFDGDYQRRVNFCQWLLRQNQRFLENVIIGDEAGFALNAINTHNVRAYCPRGEPPLNFDYQRNDDRHKLTVWVGLMGNGSIIGPSFFCRHACIHTSRSLLACYLACQIKLHFPRHIFVREPFLLRLFIKDLRSKILYAMGSVRMIVTI